MSTGGIGTIVINFFGICTFMTHAARKKLRLPDSDSAAWGNRYVLVNASDPATIEDNFFLRFFRGKRTSITPHYAQLQLALKDILTMTDTVTEGFTPAPDQLMPPESVFAWRLNNVILSIANEVPIFPTILVENVPPIPNIPKLSTFTANHEMPAPNLAMTLKTIPTRAAAYFDFFNAEIIPMQTNGGAILGQVIAYTFGNPQIRVRSFFEPTQTLSIELRSGAEVTVSNNPVSVTEDTPEDFLLHYLTAWKFPDVVALPEEGIPALPVVKTYNPPISDPELVLTVGCSNSQYP